MPVDDRWQRYTAAWRALCALRPLDHPSFSDVSRVWRAEIHPAFHDDVAVTVTDVDAGGWIELRVLPAAARAWAMAAAGMTAPMLGEAPKPRVWECALPADAVDALAASMPRLPLHNVPVAGRDGVTVDHEAVIDGVTHRFSSWCPSPSRAPLHHAYVVSLCGLAARRFTDPAALAALQSVAAYLR